MIYTTYLSKLNKIPDDSLKIMIARHAPLDTLRKYNCMHCEILSPSDTLRDMYKSKEVSYDEFINIFKDEQKELGKSPYIADIMGVIRAAVDNDKDIYLICYEKDINTCHRKYIAEKLSKQMNCEWTEAKL